jgi:hypothetical protein
MNVAGKGGLPQEHSFSPGVVNERLGMRVSEAAAAIDNAMNLGEFDVGVVHGIFPRTC